ncbi:class I SAM-dependent methyltransferase [Gorillibacterium sp. sgz500922]|uniref:class I SAM-dependent methyltransferase n=1 Tax=Gorillibacterium sp. sgz500922 TaxID=3446694 RepID=UPI003F6764D4
MEDRDGLIRAIRESMNACGGAISFRDYMELCLYHPEFGYYMNDRIKLGPGGDYYTASDVGGIVAKLIARYAAAAAKADPALRTFVEWGGGTGRTAAAILDEWKESEPELYREMTYVLIDRSPYHQARQEERLTAHGDRLRVSSEVEWQARGARSGVFHFSQELLDAFAVHRVVQKEDGHGLHEVFVEWRETTDSFGETLRPCSDPRLSDYLQRHGIKLPAGYRAEINLQAERWLTERLLALADGWVMTIDYGEESGALYAPERRLGTLMSYRNHRTVDDPYRFPGGQDLTAHLNFSALIEAGLACGVRDWKLWTQRNFLVEHGVFELLGDPASPDPFHPQARQNRAIRQLLLADRMGEVFKVLVQRK